MNSGERGRFLRGTAPSRTLETQIAARVNRVLLCQTGRDASAGARVSPTRIHDRLNQPRNYGYSARYRPANGGQRLLYRATNRLSRRSSPAAERFPGSAPYRFRDPTTPAQQVGISRVIDGLSFSFFFPFTLFPFSPFRRERERERERERSSEYQRRCAIWKINLRGNLTTTVQRPRSQTFKDLFLREFVFVKIRSLRYSNVKILIDSSIARPDQLQYTVINKLAEKTEKN